MADIFVIIHFSVFCAESVSEQNKWYHVHIYRISLSMVYTTGLVKVCSKCIILEFPVININHESLYDLIELICEFWSKLLLFVMVSTCSTIWLCNFDSRKPSRITCHYAANNHLTSALSCPWSVCCCWLFGGSVVVCELTRWRQLLISIIPTTNNLILRSMVYIQCNKHYHSKIQTAENRQVSRQGAWLS